LAPHDVIVSVAIATRDRPGLLRRVAGQVLSQLREADELVIVDDTTGQPDSYEWLGGRGRVLRSHGRGPAFARNLGWRAATGDVIAFTDDDVQIDGGWLDAIRAEFAADLALSAAEGHTRTRAFDPLYEYSVSSESARNGLTCNVAYRRSTLERLGGFDEGFPYAHCEDVDLFTRAAGVGTVKFSTAMQVEHEPRSQSPAAIGRRGRFIGSEHRLYSKHKELKPYPLPPLACAAFGYFQWPLGTLFRDGSGRISRSPRRLLRATSAAIMWWWHAARATGTLLLTAGE
jgi:GT2 family glycosyltransferase